MIKMNTTLPFVAQYSISQSDFATTLQPHIGQKTKKEKFAPPSDATKANIKAFLRALHAYETKPDDAGMQLLNGLVQKLDLNPIRLQEGHNCVLFIPKNDKTPIVCGGVLTWNFAIQTDTPFIVCDPHSGQDGTLYAITMQFLSGAKAMLNHYFNPNVDDNPNFKGNPITASNIRRFADPAHSNTTAFVPFVTGFLDVFPRAVGTVTHGMAGKPNFQLIGSNDDKAQFISNGKVSFDALMTIALALQPFPTNPNVVVVCGSVPGFVVSSSGQKAALISANNRNSPLRLNPHVGDNTDCVGHMLNGGNGPFTYPPPADKAFFMELGPKFREKGSHLMQLFAKAQAMAIDWYSKYDPAIHDPWMLSKRYPDVYNDMSKYPSLFDTATIAALRNGNNLFASSQALQDLEPTVADNVTPDASTDLSDNDITE